MGAVHALRAYHQTSLEMRGTKAGVGDRVDQACVIKQGDPTGGARAETLDNGSNDWEDVASSIVIVGGQEIVFERTGRKPVLWVTKSVT